MTTLFAFLPRLARPFRLFAVALLLAAFAVPAAFAQDFTVGDLVIGQPWARATPHGARVAAGFLTVENKGKTADRLVSVMTEAAEKAEIHAMAMSNGVMTMRPLPDGIEIPAGGTVALKPGSYHLMLIGPKATLKPGDSFKGTLTFAKAGTVEVTFMVEAMGATMPSHQ